MPKLNYKEPGAELTQHMINVAGIDSTSNVIDFGCGVGGPILNVSQICDCKVESLFLCHVGSHPSTPSPALGVDLTATYIEEANERFATQSDKVEFTVGPITNLPEEIRNGPKFSHLFSIQCFCHCARFMADVLREAHHVLDTDGIMVINDFVVAETGPTKDSSDYFYKRLHFDRLLSFAEYAEVLTENGFEIVKFENCSKHAQYGYEILGPMAKEMDCQEWDGQPLSTHYEETSKSFTRGELGMVVIVARKKAMN